MRKHKINNSLLNSLPFQGKEATRAFTLVELIVVITILAILGTIAFISLQGYSADARDSSRISDINHIKTSLELYSLDSGKYPLPDEAKDVIYSGTIIVWKQGTVGNTVTSQLSRNLNEKPTDPLYETEYVYSTLENGSKYEVMSLYEGDFAYNNIGQPLSGILSPSQEKEAAFLVIQTNAASTPIVRIDGTYNGMYVKTGDYIIPTPSIITSESLPMTLGVNTIKSQVINRGTNIPNIGTSRVEQKTGELTFNDFQVYDKIINANSSTGELLDAYNALANTYTGSSLANQGIINALLNQTTNDEKINFTKTVVLNTTSSVTSGPTTTTTYSCTGTVPESNVNKINDTDLTQDTIWQTTNSGEDCYYECTLGYTGTSCEIAPIVQWRDIPGTNCSNDDIPIGGKIWAGCNSVLGTTGISTNADVYNGTCYNYAGGTTTTNCSSTYLTYTAKESSFNTNSSIGEDNIWGKLYLWSTLSTECKNPTGGNFSNTTASTSNCACPTGWHIPTDAEFEAMETALNLGTNCRNSTDGWLCDGLGWSGKSTKTSSNNIIKALKLPLAGNRYGGTFLNRGLTTRLWSSTEYDSTLARGRYLFRNNSTVTRSYRDKSSNGFSVRCIKD